MTPRASIIVVEYRTASHIEGCLRALLASEVPRDAYEVIVLDNASPTPVDHLREQFGEVRWVHLRRNVGFAGGSTFAMSRARGDIVCGVNPDCRVAPDWIARILATFDADSRVGVVGSKILHPGTPILQHAGGRLFANGRSEHIGDGEPDHGQHDRLRDVDYVCGAAFAARRACIDEVGYLSPAYFPAYYEETELCTRARRADWRVVYAPDAVVEHDGSVASGGASSDAYLQRYHEGRMRYVLRNHRSKLLTDFLPAEAAWLRMMGPRERIICARAYARAALDAFREDRGRATEADVREEHAPRRTHHHDLSGHDADEHQAAEPELGDAHTTSAESVRTGS